MPSGWTRGGGASGDWVVTTDTSRVCAQDGSTSSTQRFIAASGGSPPAPWSGATTVAADVKLVAAGTGTPTAWVCVRYSDTVNNYCLGLLISGVQIQVAVGGTVTTSPVISQPVAIGNWYRLELAVDQTGLRGSFNGAPAVTFTPTATLASGLLAVGTRSTRAAFDNIVVTQP